jgi:hypothetical protein
LIETVIKRLENAYAFPQVRSLVLFASQDGQLLAQIAEQGVHGVEATLEALQEGRLKTVIAPYEHDQTVDVCSETL